METHTVLQVENVYIIVPGHKERVLCSSALNRPPSSHEPPLHFLPLLLLCASSGTQSTHSASESSNNKLNNNLLLECVLLLLECVLLLLLSDTLSESSNSKARVPLLRTLYTPHFSW